MLNNRFCLRKFFLFSVYLERSAKEFCGCWQEQQKIFAVVGENRERSASYLAKTEKEFYRYRRQKKEEIKHHFSLFKDNKKEFQGCPQIR